jgi:hypothetical protein
VVLQSGFGEVDPGHPALISGFRVTVKLNTATSPILQHLATNSATTAASAFLEMSKCFQNLALLVTLGR